jgi:hypothetical protein
MARPAPERAFFSLLVLASIPPACHRKIEPKECAAMLDRYIDMVMVADPALSNLPPGQSLSVREMKKAVKKAEASYAQVQTQCESEVTRHEYNCAILAKNADEWEACIE